MENTNINIPEVAFDRKTGTFSSKKTVQSRKALKDLENVFGDEAQRTLMDQEETIYEVDCYFPVEDGKSGGLFWGVTRITPGKVGDEYYMTRGHFHAKIDTGEFYWGIEGEGILLLMDEERNTWAEYMKPNSLHYIPGKVAHRVANTGSTTLVFGACWPSDAGHDYETIRQEGFGARVIEVDGQPTLNPSL